MEYSQQQLSVIESQGNLVVNAIAGSGKTSTLIGYAARRKSGRILYLAFNKSVKQEAVEKFREHGLRNVTVETAHSLALQHMRGHSLNIYNGTYQAFDAKRFLGFKLKDAIEDMRFGRHVLQLVSKFCNSTANAVSEVDYLSGLQGEDRAFAAKHQDRLILNARQFLGMMDKGEIEMIHDFYLKKYQLSQPDLSAYDCILFDEGQDASPVMLDVFLRQSATKVIVGDEHQQIYGWRHAVNALKNSGFNRKYLETSFRFDRHIGELAKSILATKNILEEIRVPQIIGKGTPSEDKTRATLGRSNSAILVDAIEKLIDTEAIKSVYFEGHFNSYTYADEGGSVYDVLNLYMGNRKLIRNPMIKAFQDFVELEEYVEKTNDASLKGIMNVVKKYGKELPGIIKTIKDRHLEHEDKDKAEMIYSTVHKAKGMEYGEVSLLGDFLGEKKLLELLPRQDVDLDTDKVLEDINVLYVAVTRAKNKLIIPDILVPEAFDAGRGKSIEIIKTQEEEPEYDDEELFFDFRAGPEPKIAHAESKAYSVKAVREKHKHAYKGWSVDEDKALQKMHRAGKKVKELAEYFGRTKGAIRSRLKKLELID